MPIAAVIALLVQVLPMIITDVPQVIDLLDAGSTAVKNAQAAPGGLVSADDWVSMTAATNVDLAQLATDAGLTPPIA